MKTRKILLFTGLILLSAEMFCQDLPDSYPAMFDKFVEYFSQIRGSNSVTKGKTVLSVFGEDKIALRFEYKKSTKNLTFEKEPDEENNYVWKAVNQLTIDMINKHEDEVTKQLEEMLELAEKKSKE